MNEAINQVYLFIPDNGAKEKKEEKERDDLWPGWKKWHEHLCGKWFVCEIASEIIDYLPREQLSLAEVCSIRFCDKFFEEIHEKDADEKEIPFQVKTSFVYGKKGPWFSLFYPYGERFSGNVFWNKVGDCCALVGSDEPCTTMFVWPFEKTKDKQIWYIHEPILPSELYSSWNATGTIFASHRLKRSMYLYNTKSRLQVEVGDVQLLRFHPNNASLISIVSGDSKNLSLAKISDELHVQSLWQLNNLGTITLLDWTASGRWIVVNEARTKSFKTTSINGCKPIQTNESTLLDIASLFQVDPKFIIIKPDFPFFTKEDIQSFRMKKQEQYIVQVQTQLGLIRAKFMHGNKTLRIDVFEHFFAEKPTHKLYLSLSDNEKITKVKACYWRNDFRELHVEAESYNRPILFVLDTIK